MATGASNYQCPACTGPLRFSGTSGKLECDYCGSVYSVEEIEQKYAAKDAAAAAAQAVIDEKNAAQAAAMEAMGLEWSSEEAAGMKVYNCPSCRAELICDGHHVHPAAIRLAFSMFGAERMILVSDTGRCAGMPEGSEFDLGGLTAKVVGGVARLESGSIACSATDLWQCMVNAISYGIPAEDAIRACTRNPAAALGAQGEVGTIATGKRADFVVCSPDFAKKRVYFGGKLV